MKYSKCLFASLSSLVIATLCCGAGGGVPGCRQSDFETMLDPENYDRSTRPLEGIVWIQEIVEYRRGEIEEIMTEYKFGKKMCLKRTLLLDSSSIEKIEVKPLPQQEPYCSLELTLSPRGRKQWIGLSLPNKGIPLAFVIDGEVYRTFVPRLINDDVSEKIVVDGPFDAATAKRLQDNSERNFFRLNH